MDQMLRVADAMGLRVKFRNLGRRYGEVHSSGLVIINPRYTLVRQRVTLAHEVGHWALGHDWSRDHDLLREEDEADSYAAELLISAVDYALAESLVGEHPGALAKELGVTRRLVELRQQQFERDRRILRVVDEWRSA